MYASNVKESDLRMLVANELRHTNITIEADYEDNRDRVRFLLKPKDRNSLEFRTLSPQLGRTCTVITEPGVTDFDRYSWRKGNGICYHGYFLFLQTLFDFHPDAKVESSYYGRIVYTLDNFRQAAYDLGDTRLGQEGNVYYPLKLRDKCNCEHIKRSV